MASLKLDRLPAHSRYAVKSFRSTADQVFQYFWPIRNHELKATILRATEPDAAVLIPKVAFRSLAIAVRLAYMPSEKGSFASICEILRSLADPEILKGLERIENDWAATLSGRRLTVFQSPEGSYNPRDILDTWLYAQVVHQDEKRQPAVEQLRVFEPLASLTLQVTVRQLAIAILNLDAVLRFALGVEQRDLTKEPSEGISDGIFWNPI